MTHLPVGPDSDVKDRFAANPIVVTIPLVWLHMWVYCNVEFSWDEAKREWVLAERGIDFLRVAFALFDGRPIFIGTNTTGE